ncbi:MAG TPA: zinc ribbon domain-containing protein [Nitrososphaeraceae archaeon]|jgi:ribosomal protein L40E|nr:zinc ribbon domain-containing protein [Nitrososphaeraceae archaeon]
MTLPKGYHKPVDITKRLRPPQEQVSRLMVDRKMLQIPLYEIEGIENITTGQIDKKVKYLELHPVEWDAQIVFGYKYAYNDSKQPFGFYIGNILDIYVTSESKGMIKKKEDLMVAMTILGIDNKEYRLRVNLNNNYVKELIDEVQALKQKEFDAEYWTYRSLTLLTSNGAKKTVVIYLLTPFLAEGEEIIWQNLKTDSNDKVKAKIIFIEVFTNYRVFRYSYEQHAGTVILLPSIDEIVVNNIQNTSNKKQIGTYSQVSHYLTSIGNVTNPQNIGDVEFIVEGRSFMAFQHISDPEKLASAIELMKKQWDNMQISEQIEPGSNKLVDHSETPPVEETQLNNDQTSQLIETQLQPVQDTESKNVATNIICSQCGNNNPVDSKFCNKCGSRLASPSCSNCGKSDNPQLALFCNQCGSKLNK